MKALLGLKFFLWGMVIFIASSFMSAFHGCESWELEYVNLRWSRSSPWGERPKKESTPAGILHVAIEDARPSQYLETSVSVARDLTKAGAKVILVAIPEEMQSTEENMQIARQFRALSNVIIGSAPQSEIKPMSRRGIDSWWVEDPFFHRVDFAWAPSTLSFLQNKFTSYPVLNEFVPLGARETHGTEYLPDIAVEIVRRYLGEKHSILLHREADAIIVGSHRIPLWGDGVAYTKATTYPVWEASVTATKQANGRMTYETYTYTPNATSRKITGDSLLARYKNKIVILDWLWITSTRRFPSYATRYWQIINSILGDSVFARHDEWDIALMVFLVIVAGLTFFRLRSILVIIILLLLGGAMVYLSFWLFNSHNVLLDPLYPLLALAASILIFPVVKLAHEKTCLKEELESLHIEKSRLEGELKEKQESSAR